MAQPGSIMWGKFFLMMGAITIGGIGLMRAVTPSEEQLYDRLSPDLKAKVDAIKAQRENNGTIRDRLQNAAAEGSDQIIWADDMGNKKSPTGGRRV